MVEALGALIAFPTVIFTAGLGLALLYWMLVIVGALDLDVLDLDAALDGVVEGAAEGAIEGAAEGGLDGVAEGGGGGLMGALSLLGLREAPTTFCLSAFFLWGWLLCLTGTQLLGPAAAHLAPGWAIATANLLGAVVFGLVLTGLTVRPFGRIFKVHEAGSKHALVGRVCQVLTGTVDAEFGQASCDDGGAGLVLAVRYEGDTPVKKGDKALLVDYDHQRDVFVIEPLDPTLLGGESDLREGPEQGGGGPRRDRVPTT